MKPHANPTEKLRRAGFWALSVAAILPFCALCFYNQPIGAHEWDWITAEGGNDYWAYQKSLYLGSGGRFSSNALMGLIPFWYTELNFQLLFLGNLLLTWAAAHFFLKKTWGKAGSGYLSTGIFVLYLSKTCGVYDSIYRYSGILTYQFGGIFLLFLLGLLYGNLISGKIGWPRLLLGLLFSFMVPGMNEVSLIAINFVFAAIFFTRWKNGTGIPKWFWAIGFFMAAGSVLAVAAPGNFRRLDSYSGGFGPVDAVLTTVGTVAYTLIGWFSDMKLLVATLLAAPILIKMATLPTVRKLFNDPAAWLGLSLVFVFLSFFGIIYGTKGASFAERVVDFTFLHFCFGWLGFAQSCAVGLVRNYPALPLLMGTKMARWSGSLLAICFFANIYFGELTIDRISMKALPIQRVRTTSNIGQIYLSLLMGTPGRYQNAVHGEYDEIKRCKTDTCLVEKPVDIPPQLYEAISDRRNRPQGEPYIGHFFNKNGPKIVRYRDPGPGN